VLEAVLDVGDALAQGLEVELDVDAGQSHRRRTVHHGHGATGGDHGLAGDAVEQVGGTADDVALDQGDVSPQTGGVGGTRRAAGTTADDDEALGTDGHTARLSAGSTPL
jgi:hypothetical protein